MDDRIDEILRRLEALELRVEEMSRAAPGHGGHEAAECPFRSEERRIVDLIVSLTADRLEERLAPRLEAARGLHDRPPAYGGPPDCGPHHHGYEPDHHGPHHSEPHHHEPHHHGPHHHGPHHHGPHHHGPHHHGPPPPPCPEPGGHYAPHDHGHPPRGPRGRW